MACPPYAGAQSTEFKDKAGCADQRGGVSEAFSYIRYPIDPFLHPITPGPRHREMSALVLDGRRHMIVKLVEAGYAGRRFEAPDGRMVCLRGVIDLNAVLPKYGGTSGQNKT